MIEDRFVEQTFGHIGNRDLLVENRFSTDRTFILFCMIAQSIQWLDGHAAKPMDLLCVFISDIAWLQVLLVSSLVKSGYASSS